MGFNDDVQRGNYEIRGGVLSQLSGGTTDNLHALTSIDSFSAKYSCSFTAAPAIILGMQTGTSYNAPLAITATTENNNEISLRVSPQGAELTMSAPASVAVGAASTSILAANSLRRYGAVSNASATQTMTLTFGAAAAVNTGIVLQPGQTYEMSLGAGNMTTQEIRAIASAAGGVVGVQEGV